MGKSVSAHTAARIAISWVHGCAIEVAPAADPNSLLVLLLSLCPCFSYGGQTVAQALVASCRTVAPQFVVHSLHSYFLRPGDDDLPIIYFVERLRNGATFASRRVTALQRGQAIFAMTVSFQTPEQGREHQQPMPAVPPPESIKSLMESYRDVLQDPRVSARVRKGLERSMVLPFPVDMRRCVPESMEQRLKPNPPVQRSWMRVQGQLGNSLMMHQCALAYMVSATQHMGTRMGALRCLRLRCGALADGGAQPAAVPTRG